MSDKNESVAPTTTAEEDTAAAANRKARELVVAGQRQINLIWECTQAVIAIVITIARVYAALYPPVGSGGEALSNAFFLIVGFYFSRTNHTAIGGIGPKPEGPYTGR